MDGFEVGCRVKDNDGFRATVRYIGPVAAAKNKAENWLGVEWDSAGRGKHNGSCVDSEGVLHQYFECGEGMGSFVKGNKVTNGRSFVDALKERYVKPDAPSITTEQDPTLPDTYALTSKGEKKPIALLGEHRLRKWQQIETVEKVAVRSDTVSTIGDSVADVAGHLIEIDLQDNLIYQWEELANLTGAIPGLRTVLLHGNKMQKVSSTVLSKLSLNATCFSGLRALALNACNIKSWAELQSLESFMPQLEEIYLSKNEFRDLPRAVATAMYIDSVGGNTSVFTSTTDTAGNTGNTEGANEEANVTKSQSEFAPEGTWTCLRILDISGCELDE